jgi:hypothetical protein
MELETNSRGENGKVSNAWKLNSTVLNSQYVQEEIKGKLENILRQMKMKTQHTRPIGCNKSITNREAYGAICLHLKRRFQVNILTFTPMTRKRRSL